MIIERHRQAAPGSRLRLPLLVAALLLAGCGGGGSGTQSVPTVSLSALPATVSSGGMSTLTWTSSNAAACTASGGWSGPRATAGNQSTGALSATTTYTLSCTGTGGTANRSSTVTVSTSGSLFPLRTEAGKRYLIDAQGNPFFMNGDTAWAMMVQLDLAEAETYLEDRRQRGINAVVAELIENTFGDNAPANYAGDYPFTGADFATPNEAYFAHAAALVDLAASKGMLVLLSPAYMGYQGHIEGWYPEMVAAGATVLRNYGRYLSTRFAGRDNIMWVHGGDWDPPQEGVVLATAVAEGIIERDPGRRWLHTVHSDRNTSALDSSLGNEAWLTMDVIYTSDTTVVAEAYSSWTNSPLPFILYESYYEDTSDGNFIRKMAYQATLSGASGHVMGNNTVWKAKPGWQNYLDSDGARSMPHIKSLFTTRAWWLLVPDIGSTFLTGGVNPGAHQAPAALASDRSFGLVYTQEFRQLTVNLSRLAGPLATIRWFDPSNGNYTPVAGSPFTATGSRTVSPPGNNSQGAGDWILVLESTP